ncbi:MAG: mechanosensitive ion channel family protein [Candidatus Altiarchaeota archaeon]
MSEPVFSQYYASALYALATLAASVIVAKLVYAILGKYASRVASKTKSDLDDRILEKVKAPVYYIIILVGFNLALGGMLSERYAGIAGKAISSLLILVAAWAGVSLVDILILDFGKKLVSKTKTTVDDQALPFLSKVAKIALYAVAVTIILDRFGYSITPIVASLGVAGIAVGFAAKDTLSNLLGGFFIMADRPFVIGDRIQVGSNIGEVIDVGLRTTKIETLEHTIVIIPNSEIVMREVTNYSLPDVRIIVKHRIGVAYGSDPEKVKRILTEIARSCKVLPEPEPRVYFTEFADSSLNFDIVFWVDDFRKKPEVIDEINTKINKRFQEEGIEIPYPTRTVYLKK